MITGDTVFVVRVRERWLIHAPLHHVSVLAAERFVGNRGPMERLALRTSEGLSNWGKRDE